MRIIKPLPPEVIELAAGRHGALLTRELVGAGVSSPSITRRVAAGLLQRERYGVLVVPSLRDGLTPIAAIQLVYPAVVAERRTAAYVWQLDGFKDHPGCLEPVHRPTSQRPAVPGLRYASIPDRAITSHAGIRVTTAGWTLADLDACPGVDADRVELAVESALRAALTTDGRLRRLAAMRGAVLLAAALSRRRIGDPPTESYAETRFLQRIVRPLGLEDPERQVEVPRPDRRPPYRCDFVFRRARPLDVEIDGRDTHDPDQDAVRDNYLRGVGYGVARIGARPVESRRNEVCVRLVRELEAVSAAPPPPAAGTRPPPETSPPPGTSPPPETSPPLTAAPPPPAAPGA